MICRAGIGLTAPSRFLVRKSQKILGQKKASMAAHIWSGGGSVDGTPYSMLGIYAQAAAVRMTKRAQWFLINFPMAPALSKRWYYKRKDEVEDRPGGKRRREQKVNDCIAQRATSSYRPESNWQPRAGVGFCYTQASRRSSQAGRFLVSVVQAAIR